MPADHPVAAPLRQVLPVGNLATLKTTGQQRVAVLVADIGEVLAGHADAGRPGALQTINEVPFLFRHRPLENSSYVLVLVGGVGSRRKNGRIGRSNNRSVAVTVQSPDKNTA